jgi:dodecin
VVYKYIDIVGTSQSSITDAVNNAFKEASKTIKNIQWGEMGKVTFKLDTEQKIEYQAEVRIGFRIERSDNTL